MATLNRQKPYAEVFGGDSPVRFEQDGKGFDVHGNQVAGPPDAAEGQAETVDGETPRKRGKKPNVEP
jgi:hypothetical protein